MRTQGSRLLVTSGNRRIWHLNIGLLGVALASALVSTGACVRDPLPSACPELAAGDLVVTEIRGDQAGSYRQWIEIYNVTDAAIPVAGLRLTLTQFDGDGSQTFVVRDEVLELAPGEYLVLGSGDPATLDYIDYDFSTDQPGDLYAGATLELSACETVIDKLIYTLPEEGTLALDGAITPSAAANDDSKVGWCVDDRASEGPQTQIGIRGTPGGANPPCP
jgi:hypothetical protein